MANDEKKVYPSQLNTKTISARIPIQDYVNFLQDSLLKGISLNDFLLMKIYNNSSVVGNLNNEESKNIKITEFDLFEYSQDKSLSYYFDNDNNRELICNKELIMEALVSINRKQKFIDELLKNDIKNKIASIENVKIQLSILINNQFKNRSEKSDYKAELFQLLDELE